MENLLKFNITSMLNPKTHEEIRVVFEEALLELSILEAHFNALFASCEQDKFVHTA